MKPAEALGTLLPITFQNFQIMSRKCQVLPALGIFYHCSLGENDDIEIERFFYFQNYGVELKSLLWNFKSLLWHYRYLGSNIASLTRIAIARQIFNRFQITSINHL